MTPLSMANDITRVLLVEPDADAQQRLHGVLTNNRSRRYVVSGASALGEVGPDTDCDVIVAARDTAGPEFESLRRVRQDLPAMPIVLMVGEGHSPDVAQRAIDAGADEVLLADDLTASRVEHTLRMASTRRAGRVREPQAGDERFRRLVDSTDLGLFEFEPSTGQLSVSGRTRRSFGLAPDDPVTYASLLQRVQVHDRPRIQGAMEGALRGEKDGQYSAEFRTVDPGDGQERWLAAWGRLAAGGAGEPDRLVGVTQDISERKRAEGALVDADRRRAEFLATLAHELRNPLAPIRFAVRMLEPHLAVVPAAARPLAVIDRQVSHVARLIDDLLDVSRITRNKIELRVEETNLGSILQAAIEANEPLLEAAGHRLESDVPQTPIPLAADAARLVQVFSNLLNNAIKFTPAGGTIRLSATRTASDVQVSVTDDGMGIAPEVLPHVFDLFRQEDVTLERSAGGLGIGLTIAQALVAMHGGTIEARSGGPGAGAEFIVRLPALATEPTAAADGVALPPATASLRVLIVDDNRDAAEMLELFTRARGHEAAVAFEGYTAVRVAGDFRPDVVLLDIGMPGMNGYSVARMLRQRATGTRMFVVAVTGWGQEDDRRRGRDAGFDLHLTKPVDPVALERLFERIAHTRLCPGCDACFRAEGNTAAGADAR